MPLTPQQQREIAEKITKEWADRGMIMEGGWQAFLATSLHGASEIQQREMRKAYYLGAQHLFASIFCALDHDSEPTERDMKRLDLITKELERFAREVNANWQ